MTETMPMDCAREAVRAELDGLLEELDHLRPKRYEITRRYREIQERIGVLEKMLGEGRS